MKNEKSSQLFKRAQKTIPGGVNSPVRACKSVGREPLFIERAEGARIFDADGNAYIDYVASWGPMILGHRHPAVIQAISEALDKGTSYGAPTALEIEMAEMIVDAVPSVEMVRMVNSGTEATMSAIRLARAVTERDAILKFDGCYHGHGDALLATAGSGVATLGIPGSPGVPRAFVEKTISLPFNDIDRVEDVMDKRGSEIACIIVEPIAANMGFIAPAPGFLESLRELADRHGTLLIFDEVITGFRVAYGGAQALFDITPDLTTLGKIIGGGLPVGAYGGKKAIMEKIAPQGPVYQAGTLSGNPVAMAAGVATLKQLQTPGFYEQLEDKADRLQLGIGNAIGKNDIKATVKRIGSLLGIFFTNIPVRNFDDAKTADLEMFTAFYNGLLEEGIYIAPSQFEAMFVSAAHSEEDIDATVQAISRVLSQIGQ